MEELKNKVFLVKVPTELIEFLKNSKESKVGYMKILLNKKRKRKPQYTLKFNKENGPSKFSLIFSQNKDFFFFNDQDKKEDIKINNIDNFGKLIVKDENEQKQLIENIQKQSNKSKEIEVKSIKGNEKKYKEREEIQLTDIKYINRDKKEKRVRIEKNLAVELIKKDLSENNRLTPKEIADKHDIPENQVKEIINEYYDTMINNKEKFYQLKEEIEI